MLPPYKRSFNRGHQSELLYNEKLFLDYKATEHLLDEPDPGAVPDGEISGQLWLKRPENELKTYVQKKNRWENVFASKFQIVDQMMYLQMPADPVIGQLWINQGVLMYWDGSTWLPIRALEQPYSQFNLAAFSNFMLISPVWTDLDVITRSYYLKIYNDMYMAGKLNKLSDSIALYDGSFYFGRNQNSLLNEPTLTELDDKVRRILVPDITIDRMFLDNDIDFSYHEINRVCIEYPVKTLIKDKKLLTEKIPTLIHVNPGRVTKVTKTLFQFDRANPLIEISPVDTEFYGFHNNNPEGELLIPQAIESDGTTKVNDYEKVDNGIYLSYSAAHNYDYILAVSYEFSWIRMTGTLKVTHNKESIPSYYLDDFASPTGMFVDGYTIEDPDYEEDNLSKTITLLAKNYPYGAEVAFMYSPMREYGFIRQVDLKGRGIIRTVRAFNQPLIFVNGEALYPGFDDIEFGSDNTMYIPNTLFNMSWVVVELNDGSGNVYVKTGYAEIQGGNVVIPYSTSKLPSIYSAVLFVDGLLIKKSDIISVGAGKITVKNLRSGQSYILISDPNNYLYDESKIHPALVTGAIDATLVYRNGKLLCDPVAITKIMTKVEAQQKSQIPLNHHNEIKCLLPANGKRPENLLNGVYCYWDKTQEKWIDIASSRISGIKKIVDSYENTLRSVRYKFPINSSDEVYVYGFRYASSFQNPVIIKNVPYGLNDWIIYKLKYDEATEAGNNAAMNFYKKQLDLIKTPQSVIDVPEGYDPSENSLSVYVNGVRQYDVLEHKTGKKFTLPKPVEGIVTYVIERPEQGKEITAEREILTEESILPGASNVYRTKMSLYPGRVNIYIDGVRQDRDAYTIMDNNTLLINSKKLLVGHKDNFPKEKVLRHDGISEITHKNSDKILVEVKQDYDRHETYLEVDNKIVTTIDIPNHSSISEDILETQDEIFIYLDGLFLGLRLYEGYYKDISTKKIRFLSPSFIERMTTDPLKNFLTANAEINKKFMAFNKNKKYSPPKKHLLLEWR